MAITVLGSELTSRHRLAQLRLRTVTLRDLLRVWPAFDPVDIAGSWGQLEPALIALIQSRQPISAGLSARYITAFREAEAVAGGFTPSLAPMASVGEIVGGLRFVGPMNALRLVQLSRPAAEIARTTLANVEGEVTRRVLNGGRQTIVDSIQIDRRALGYTRVTDGAPCAFCALLAGRGPVYKADTVDFQAHRACGCTGEPMYRQDQPWPESAQRFADRYRQAAAAVPKDAPDWSAEVRREFRRLHDAA